jgi:PAP2 superfamily
MNKIDLSVKYLLAALLIAVLAVTIASPAVPAQAAPAGSAALIDWNKIAVRTILAPPPQSPPASFVYASYTQAAVYNAVMAIEGGYEPYKSGLASSPGASVDAAVATAAHNILAYYFPGQIAALDADYAASLNAIPAGAAKTQGIQVGADAAAEVIALRDGDGRNADIGFTMPASAPGVWELPPNVSPLVPWMSRLRPFLLESPDQFRPGPPLDLSSSEWAEEYNEVLAYGRADSTVRTQEQTDAARFWITHTLLQYNTVFQKKAETRNAVEAARLMAMGNMVAADALIGCFDAKYHYLFWRPLFAIPKGETDANPATIGDPTFVPLIPTPPHPEYPSAHGCVTSAIAEVLTEVLGTQSIEIDVPSTVPGIGPRHFSSARDLVQDVIQARVWGGIHYHQSTVTGANLGRKVAHWTFKHYFLPDN